MKKTILIAALILSAVMLKAQTVSLKGQYLPKHVYTSNLKMDMDVAMGQAAGGMNMKTNISMDFDAKTGTPNASGSFPLALKYTGASVKMNINGEEKQAPASPVIGKTINGTIDKSGKFTIGTIEGGALDEATKNSVLLIVQQMQEQMQFPAQPVKVGQSIKQTVPMNFSGAGGQMKMLVDGVYTLTAVKGDQAFFDFKQDMKIDVSKVDQTTGFNGTGNGKIIYSIAQKYPTSLVSNMLMKINAPGAGDVNVKIAMDLQTAVSGN